MAKDTLSTVPLNHPIGRKIAVYGAGGKSTLAKAIAARHSLEYIELDAIHHMPGWQPRPFGETRDIVLSRMAAAPQGWVIEGNYAELRPSVLPQVDSAVVIQLPFRVIFWRVFKRTVRRAWTREVIHGGNRESWRISFASRYSILCEVWQKRHIFGSMGETIRSEMPADTCLFLLRSSREMNEFYAQQGLSRD